MATRRTTSTGSSRAAQSPRNAQTARAAQPAQAAEPAKDAPRGQPAPAAEKPAPRRPAAEGKPPAQSGAASGITVSPEARRAMIEQAAYLRSERHGFSPGREVEDWLAAEAEVDALLRAGEGRAPQ
jgi:hypothetical protein